MAMDVREAIEWCERYRNASQWKAYMQADLEVNGDAAYYAALGAEVERRPIMSRRCIGMRGTSEF